MTTQVEVPAMGESITEAVLLKWHKGEGEQVAIDEPICELETDKATFDLPAPSAGVLHHAKEAGQTVHVGEAIASIEPAAAKKSAAKKETPLTERKPRTKKGEPAPLQAASPPAKPPAPLPKQPAAERAATVESPRFQEPPVAPPEMPPDRGAEQTSPAPPAEEVNGTRRVPMSKIRRRIAERLVRAQHTAAMLTTFNEIDMTAVLDLRARHQQRFSEVHGVPLGLMSFFARGCVLALKQFPALNAELDDATIVYHDHVHLGIAVSTDRGLVVPVLRHAEGMSFAQVESEIKRVAAAARDGKLALEELSGGTFTITNGGIFGSLLSTPILNPPQTGILGMHAIQKRPAVVGDQILARPMMYVALTYDHRLVDGREAVLFLVKLKQLLEDPMGMLFEV